MAYSRSREGIDVNYFGEDSTRSSELRQPLGAHAIKSVLVPGCLSLQVTD